MSEPPVQEHEFVLLINGELQTFTDFDELPEAFSNVIKFQPYISIDPPETEHTEGQANAKQAEITLWIERLQALIENEA